MMEADKRFNYVSVLVGDRGTGKTTWLKGDPSVNIKGLFPSYLEQNKKVLITDTLDHPAYREFPMIRMEQIPRWKKGVYRLIIRPDEFVPAIEYFQEHIWNALVVVEDAYKVMQERIPKPVSRYIIDTKQKNVDMIFMYHTWGWVVPKLATICDAFEIFKTEDSPEIRKQAIAGCYNRVLQAYNQVMADPSPFARKSVLK